MSDWIKPPSVVHFDNVPEILKLFDRWVVWKWVPKGDRSRKWDKPPKQPDGRPARVNKSQDWHSFEEVKEAYEAGGWDGIGIIIPEDFVGIDVDKCVKDRELNGAGEMFSLLADTYTEYSPSGTGIKSIALGKLNPDLPKTSNERGLELYDGTTGRYFTITGDVVGERTEIKGAREGIRSLQEILAQPIESSPFADPATEEESEALEAEVRELVWGLNPERATPYDSWRNVCCAIKETCPHLFDLFHEWSQQSPAYVSEANCQKLWDDLRRTDGRVLTFGSLKYWAKEDGFRPNKYRADSVSAADFLSREIERDYIVENFLVAKEPMLIGGPSKVLKTSISLDLVVSIATGTPFLGQKEFAVPTPRRVLMISGESGETTIQDSLWQIVKAKGLDRDDLSRLRLSFRLPKIDAEEDVKDLLAECKKHEIDVLVLDPLYLAFRPGDAASNIYSMGEKFQLLAEQIGRVGLTLLLLHHFRKQGRNYEDPPELEDFSQSGVAEFARQWLLLKRRKQYEHDGKHCLWMNYGGSAGHQGGSIAEIDTGTYRSEGGLKWGVELFEEKVWTKAEAARQKKERDQKDLADCNEAKGNFLRLVEEGPELGKSELKKLSKLKPTTFERISGDLIEEGLLDIRTEGQRKILHRTETPIPPEYQREEAQKEAQ